MATSGETDLRRIWRGFMRWLSNQYRDGEQPGYTQPSKHEWYDAIVAADAWADSAEASYNNALPNPVKQQAPQTLKALLLICVLIVRYAPGLAAPLARWLGQEVD